MSVSPFPHCRIGDLTLTAIGDGDLAIGLDLLSGIAPDEAAHRQAAAGQVPPGSIHLNAYLVQGGGRALLIDAGAGTARPGCGGLAGGLAGLGLTPADIDAVLLTHAHPDHVGGLIDADGTAAFPRAELLVPAAELAFWRDEAHLARADERQRGQFRLARQAFAAYQARLRPIGAGALFAGLEAVPLPGHTAGHGGYLIEGGGQSLLVWGDLVHFPAIQIPRPAVSIRFDQDPVLAVATRARLLDRLAADHTLVAGMHLGAAGFGWIEPGRDGLALRYRPLEPA
ncbi:MBL fold metallo-hydrolase [Phaeospirillum tilakii]|uniref:MBL fold metallo-hydrolase n=1 Tax=Phaeospirillum tilakii TaxID=741673 RepID=A0ABW5CBS3_9PROT